MYHGRPSKACGPCRRKRIRCDLVRTGCGQCIRACVSCHGYRNESELRFLDETDKVVNKHKAKSQFSLHSVSSESVSQTASPDCAVDLEITASAQDEQSPDSSPDIQLETILPSIRESTKDLATGYLLSTYVEGSHFEYLPDLYKKGPHGGPLPPCMYAVGLAGISHEFKRPEVMILARYMYSHALRKVNNALTSPELAVHDDTLASIMLLSLFETITHEQREVADKWTRHVDGASALLLLRGSTQMKTSIGHQLFMQVISNIRVSCIQQGLHVPEKLRSLSLQSVAVLPPEGPGVRFGPIADSFAALRADIQDGNLTDPIATIHQAQYVDRQAELLATYMQLNRGYDIICTQKLDPAIYGTIYHIYDNHHIAQLWNTIRMTRLMCNDIIHDNLSKLDPGDISDYHSLGEQSFTIMANMAADILASVPQYTGFLTLGFPLASPVVASKYFLVWPLQVVGSCTSLDSGHACMRAYTVDRLRYIGDYINAEGVVQMADLLEARTESPRSDWSHAYHLF